MANEFTLSEIATITGGELLGRPTEKVRHILLDSRKYFPSGGEIFFALKGRNHNGHEYIDSLYNRGLRCFVVEKAPAAKYESANFVVVSHALMALQELAAHIRRKSLAQIIGITGSNGKTVVKEWLWQILRFDYSICRNPGSYNSQIGVPLSVWELKYEDEFGIFEAGISEPGEMKHLEHILKPEMGIITNIGSAHRQFFDSDEQKAREKLLLFKDSTKVIYCQDDPVLKKIIPAEQAKWTGWSRIHKNAALHILQIKSGETSTRIKALYHNDQKEILIPFIDDASIENAIHCWLFVLEIGLKDELIYERFQQLQSVAMRLELKSGSKGSIIINDSYNSDLESLSNALNFLDQQAHKRGKVVVLSDMLQSGVEPEMLYSEISRILNQHEIKELIGIGPEMLRHKELFSDQFHFYNDSDSFLKESFRYNWENKAVLIKGARPFRLEAISRKLESKTHETVMEIHLSRLVHNLNYYRSKLKENVQVMAMVKAFSYGSGSYEIASLLQFHNVNYLAVAYTDEGVELRKAGIMLPILVLNAEPSSFDDLITYGLEPEIYSFRMLELFSKALDNSEPNTPHLIHIKLETGMHRLGFESDDLKDLIDQINANTKVKVASVFSHLAAADDPFKRHFTEEQIEEFSRLCEILEQGIGPFKRHILNSSGIEGYADAQFDMVRLGIGLYGISSNVQERKYLQQVSEFKATVSQVKSIKEGDTVGYGQSFKAGRAMTIATITVGYADGLRRNLSNGNGRVWIKGNFHKIIGKVCMDMAMVDVSDSDVREGDEVEIFGPNISLYDLAASMETIPYEVLTGISSRVRRVYFME